MCIAYSGIPFAKMTNINNLIKFRGNLKPSEKGTIGITPYVNVRTFLRTLRNHFATNNITSDQAKIRILHNQIDATVGDAIDLINCYSGEDVTFEEIEKTMIKMYPEFRKTNFRVSATSMSKFKLDDNQLFCSMTKLIQESKALAVAYLSNEQRNEFGINEDTKFQIKLPGPADRAGNAPTFADLMCRDLLQNFIIHFFLASQLDSDIYEKVAGITPAVNACEFMGKTVERAEEIRMTKLNSKKKEEVRDIPDVLFNVKENARDNKIHTQKDRSSKSCFNCGNNDHFIKDCPNCLYCKKRGHDAYKCYKRRDDKVPYCINCKRPGHLPKDCYFKSKNNTVRTPQNTKYYAKGNNNNTNKMKSDKRERVRIIEDVENPDVDDDMYESEENSELAEEQV